MIREGYILGIDPDVERNGIALLDCQQKRLEYVGTLRFPDVIRYFDSLSASDEYKPLKVVIEDSDISTNWHYNTKDRAGVIAAKGRSVGMCHATIRHLKECAVACGLDVVMMRPLRKCWKGKGGKITHLELAQFATGLPKQTNQESRDAVLLAWCYADFPMLIKPTRV